MQERERFYEVLPEVDIPTYVFCAKLYWTGARFSESITHIDAEQGRVVFETLKREIVGVEERQSVERMWRA